MSGHYCEFALNIGQQSWAHTIWLVVNIYSNELTPLNFTLGKNLIWYCTEHMTIYGKRWRKVDSGRLEKQEWRNSEFGIWNLEFGNKTNNSKQYNHEFTFRLFYSSHYPSQNVPSFSCESLIINHVSLFHAPQPFFSNHCYSDILFCF